MTLNFGLQIANDLDFVDGLELVTLTRRDGIEQAEIPALGRLIGVREAAASNGRYLAEDRRFHIKVNSLEGEPAPVPGDTITDAGGTVWTVLALAHATRETRYGLTCRNLVVTENLTTLLTIQKATYTKGTYGEQVATWANVAELTDIRGKIQPSAVSRSVDQGRLSRSASFTAYLMTSFQPAMDQRIIDSNGTKYRITGYREKDNIAGLLEVDCEIDTSEV